MRTHAEKALHSGGGDLGLLAPGSSKTGAREPPPSIQFSLGGRARQLSLRGDCLVSKVLPTRHHATLNQIHVSWEPSACAMNSSVCSCACWHKTYPCLARVQSLPLQGSRAQGCRQRRGEGAHRHILSPTPRGPGLREGGGASLISLPPWQGGPSVLRQPVGEPWEASLKLGKGVPESTGAAAAGSAVGLLGVRLQLASWVLRSCQ